MASRSSSSPAITKRPPVAKRPGLASILKRQSSARNLYKMEEKAANHDAMLQRFHLRKMSSGLGFPTKFARANEVVIDKAIGSKSPLKRRFSFRRSVRVLTGARTRQHMLKSLTAPIAPKSWTSTVHGILMFAVYHFQLMYLPFAPSYYPNGSLGATAIAIWLESFFLVDLLLNLNTAFVDQGFLVTSRWKIATNYLRKWFAFDLLSAIPMQAIYCIVTDSLDQTHPALRAVQLTLIVLRILRVTFLEKRLLLNRVMRVGRHVAEWIRYSRYSHLLGIAQLMWLVLLIAHYMACLWHVVSRAHVMHTNGSSAPAEVSVGELYVADYYYAVSLIQGQGNAVGSWGENLYSSVAIIVGSVILAIVFGNVAMLVSNFNANTTNYHRKMEAVYATMDKMDLPLKLRERVSEYYTHVWNEYEAVDGNINKFQQELTHTLGIEIGLYKHMNLVVKIPFWEDCTPDFLTQIVLNLGVRVYMPDDYVVRRREIGSEMMMINRGYCKLSKPYKSAVDSKEGEDGISALLSKPVLLTQDLVGAFETSINQATDSENDSDGLSSDEEDSQNAFGGGMFGSSLDSRRMSGNTLEEPVDMEASDFTDVRRFRQVHPRRPSYPSSIGPKKPRKYREYLHPGQGFGEMSLLMNYKRTANIRAITFVEMCVLDRKSFQKIISRYPEDRRRVLTKMLESCIEKKVIPFPWESIIEAVSAKRRNSGSKNISRDHVIATMTAAEAARILVEAIDVNTPDDTIKYGFQSFNQGFIEDSSLRHVNSADAKISNTLRRNSGMRAQMESRRNSRVDSLDGTASTSELTETESDTSGNTSSGSSDRTLKNLLILVQSMANNIERLQQDMSELKSQSRQPCCDCRCRNEVAISSNFRTASANLDRVTEGARSYGPKAGTNLPAEDSLGLASGAPAKEDHHAQIARKASLVAFSPLSSPSNGAYQQSGSEKQSSTILRKKRSNAQESRTSSIEKRHSDLRQDPPTTPMKSPNLEYSPMDGTVFSSREKFNERSPVNLSSRSKAARTHTLADALWSRSNTSGDMLKHTEEERNAARIRRQIRTRHSLPTELSSGQGSDSTVKPDEVDSDGADILKPPTHGHLFRHSSAQASLDPRTPVSNDQ